MSETKAQPQQIWATELTANDSSAKELVGVVRWEYDNTYGLRAYRYVQAASDTTVANGTVLTYSDSYKFTATSDVSDAASNQIAGVGIGAITASYYGWVQCYGYHSAVITNADDDIADGDVIIVDTDEDGQCDSIASGASITQKILGIAVAADVDGSDTVAAQLCCV